jgi:hypothetical protein
VKDFKRDIEEFPELKERLLKSSMRYYLGCYLHKKPTHPDHMPLEKIEDLMSGFTQMLGYLVDDLVFRGKKNEARGICERHQLFDVVRNENFQAIKDIVYDPKADIQTEDRFGPLTSGEMISMPPHVKVEWVGTLEDI